MVMVVPIGKAKITLSQLVKRAAAGETILICIQGRLRAKLVNINDTPHPARRKIFGSMKGKLMVPNDFDAPLPNDVLDAFEGRGT